MSTRRRSAPPYPRHLITWSTLIRCPSANVASAGPRRGVLARRPVHRTDERAKEPIREASVFRWESTVPPIRVRHILTGRVAQPTQAFDADTGGGRSTAESRPSRHATCEVDGDRTPVN